MKHQSGLFSPLHVFRLSIDYVQKEEKHIFLDHQLVTETYEKLKLMQIGKTVYVGVFSPVFSVPKCQNDNICHFLK